MYITLAELLLFSTFIVEFPALVLTYTKRK